MIPQGTLRVLLVEDHDMVARGIEAALGAESDIEVVARVATVADGVARYAQLLPDVVVMDYRLPDGRGTDATRAIRAADDDASVLLLTGFDDSGVVSDALDAGCRGFVTKEASIETLAGAIRSVSAGAAVFPAAHLSRLFNGTADLTSIGADLTAREREVLELMAEGRSTEEIASGLFLSAHTVRNHVRNILLKLQARTKLEAVVVAARAGVVDLRPAL